MDEVVAVVANPGDIPDIKDVHPSISTGASEASSQKVRLRVLAKLMKFIPCTVLTAQEYFDNLVPFAQDFVKTGLALSTCKAQLQALLFYYRHYFREAHPELLTDESPPLVTPFYEFMSQLYEDCQDQSVREIMPLGFDAMKTIKPTGKAVDTVINAITALYHQVHPKYSFIRFSPRLADVLRISIDDIDFETNTLIMKHTKTGIIVTVPLADNLMHLLHMMKGAGITFPFQCAEIRTPADVTQRVQSRMISGLRVAGYDHLGARTANATTPAALRIRNNVIAMSEMQKLPIPEQGACQRELVKYMGHSIMQNYNYARHVVPREWSDASPDADNISVVEVGETESVGSKRLAREDDKHVEISSVKRVRLDLTQQSETRNVEFVVDIQPQKEVVVHVLLNIKL